MDVLNAMGVFTIREHVFVTFEFLLSFRCTLPLFFLCCLLTNSIVASLYSTWIFIVSVETCLILSVVVELRYRAFYLCAYFPKSYLTHKLYLGEQLRSTVCATYSAFSALFSSFAGGFFYVRLWSSRSFMFVCGAKFGLSTIYSLILWVFICVMHIMCITRPV